MGAGRWTYCALLGFVLLATCSAAGATASATCKWHVVLPLRTVLTGVTGHVSALASAGPNDVWVGGQDNVRVRSRTLLPHPLLAHWDGHSWHVAPAPVRGGVIEALAATAPDAAWAILSRGSGPMLVHWNGSAWLHVLMPGGVGDQPELTVGAGRRAWLVGARVYTYAHGSWRPMDALGRSSGNTRIVVAAKTSALWRIRSFGFAHTRPPAVDRWDGSRWVQTPLKLRARTDLYRLLAFSARDAWLSGSDGDHALLFRWDGRAWRGVRGPPADAVDATVEARAGGGVWLGGGRCSHCAGLARSFPPYLRRWNGRTWATVVPPSGLSSDSVSLYTVGRETWATSLQRDDVFRLACGSS